MGAGRALDGFGWGSECIPGTDLDGLDGFEIGLDGSGMLWAALGSFE